MSLMPRMEGVRLGTSLLCLGLTGLAVYSAVPHPQPASTLPSLPRIEAADDLPAAPASHAIYAGGLQTGWQDWSWAAHELNAPEVKWNNAPSLRFEPDGWKGVYLHHDPFDTTGYTTLTFWIHGGSTGQQNLAIATADVKGGFGEKVPLARFVVGGSILPNKWQYAVIPLTRLSADRRKISGFVFQDNAGKPQGRAYLADIALNGKSAVPSAKTAPKPSSGGVTVELDTTQDVHPISPLIYGMASADADYLRDLRLGSNRWGGNPNTRYNWERGNCWNAARDWEFRNGNYNSTTPGDRQPSGVADKFVMQNRAANAATVLTIPTIGYVSKDDNPESRSLNVPSTNIITPTWGIPVSPGSAAVAGYDPAENRRRTSIPSYASKPKSKGALQYPPDLTDNAVYQDEWVYHLVQKFGNAANGGVRFYAMDNEADLWDMTHTDIHPVALSYDDLLANFLEYATAVKAVDPTGQITGPVSWGWTGYQQSPRDRGDFNRRPDRRAHGDLELIPWFLQQVQKHDQRTGKRTLDVLDIHFYPQGPNVYQGATDAATDALRLRQTRGLWDATYKDESWIQEPIRLIPRMKEYIAKYYPGTKLGITEWNFGADGTMNGGIAAAEALGILGREGVYLANYWAKPPARSPGYFAFKLFRNADDAGNGFGETSVRAISSQPNAVSCYGSVESKTGQPVLLLINKEPMQDATVTVRVKHGRPVTKARLWQYASDNKTAIVPLPTEKVVGGSLKVRVPGYSLLLLRFE